jgi:hypothetical protein
MKGIGNSLVMFSSMSAGDICLVHPFLIPMANSIMYVPNVEHTRIINILSLLRQSRLLMAE